MRSVYPYFYRREAEQVEGRRVGNMKEGVLMPIGDLGRVGGLTMVLYGSLLGVASAQSEKPADKPATGAEAAKPAAIKPGKDRWPVKTGADLDAGEVARHPKKATVEQMLAFPRPIDMPLSESNPFYQDRRARPVETSIWTVEADVTQVQLMPDGDYRVTIRGASGQTMVLEMPNPDPAFVDPKGPFAAKIKTARTQFDSKMQPEHTPKPLTLHARITGIGFFGRAWGKKKVTGNLVQLHPVLNIEWLPKATTEFNEQSKKSTKPAKPEPGLGG